MRLRRNKSVAASRVEVISFSAEDGQPCRTGPPAQRVRASTRFRRRIVAANALAIPSLVVGSVVPIKRRSTRVSSDDRQRRSDMCQRALYAAGSVHKAQENLVSCQSRDDRGCAKNEKLVEKLVG